MYEQDSVVTEWEDFLQGIACSPRPPSVQNRELAVDASNFPKYLGGVTCCTHDGHLDNAAGDGERHKQETFTQEAESNISPGIKASTLGSLEDNLLGKQHEGIHLNVRGGQNTSRHHKMSRSERRHDGAVNIVSYPRSNLRTLSDVLLTVIYIFKEGLRQHSYQAVVHTERLHVDPRCHSSLRGEDGHG